jgi:hypothetical protein
MRTPESLTLLDPQRQRNLGKILITSIKFRMRGLLFLLRQLPECKNRNHIVWIIY